MSLRHWGFVCKSLCRCLWSPQPCDLLDLALSRPQQQHSHNMQRLERCVRQYSRALNSAFVQVRWLCYIQTHCNRTECAKLYVVSGPPQGIVGVMAWLQLGASTCTGTRKAVQELSRNCIPGRIGEPPGLDGITRQINRTCDQAGTVRDSTGMLPEPFHEKTGTSLRLVLGLKPPQ